MINGVSMGRLMVNDGVCMVNGVSMVASDGEWCFTGSDFEKTRCPLYFELQFAL